MAMFGVLVDVSGSMKSAYTLDRSSDVSVERTHAILTTIMNIVKRQGVGHLRQEYIFACAFGMSTRTPAETCDLITLLEGIAGPENLRREDAHQAFVDLAREHGAPQAEPRIKHLSQLEARTPAETCEIAGQENSRKEDPYQALVDLAREHGATQAERWIEHLSQLEARLLIKKLRLDPSLIPKLIQLLPLGVKAVLAYKIFRIFRPFVSEESIVHDSEAYKFVLEIIGMHLPEPRPVQYVAELLDNLLQSRVSSTSAQSSTSPSLHDKIGELVEPLKSYIFGYTPMCKALNDACAVFSENNAYSNVLFILSDGFATDGDPLPIAQKLRDMGVTIVACFLTSDYIDNPRCLFDEADPNWEKGRSALFEMSSSKQNIDAPISYLIDTKWKLPPSGVSRLFLQANTLDVVNEFCKTVVSQMTEPQ